MNLLQVREKFAQLSGRHDLVTDFAGADYSDNGADFFIDSGQKTLDRLQPTPKSLALYKKDIAADTYILNAKYSMAVKGVWIINADGRKVLDKKDWSWILEEYGEKFGDVTTGTPLYYAPIYVGLSPEQAALTADNYGDQFTYESGEIYFGNHFEYNGVLFMPPADELFTMTILAKFKSITLDGDAVVSYWSDTQPDLLVLAALYSLERFYRNSEGMKDYMGAIQLELDGIDKDLVEEDLVDIDQMEG